MSDQPIISIPPSNNGENVLSACPAVLANDPNYLANDPRACAGSGVVLSGAPKATVRPTTPSVR